MRTFAALVTTLALSACASSGTTIGFPSADADDNDMLSQSEFDVVFEDTGFYGEFDVNDDGMLSRAEYNEAVDDAYATDEFFIGYDRDRSGSLSRQEFVNGWFFSWDSDRSGSLDSREYSAAIAALDTDG